MSVDEERMSTSRASEAVVSLSGDPSTSVAAARRVHGGIMAGTVYGTALRKRLASLFEGLDLGQSSVAYAEDLLERMAPRDPAEEMLITQMLMAQVRTLHLTSLANQQTELDSLRVVNEYADRASNTYRRLMLALAEYRRPARAGDSFTAIAQANIAGQQLVVNERDQFEKATNEQERDQDGDRENPPALSADPGGTEVTAGVSPQGPALEVLHRSANDEGQSTKSDERLEAR
jgi:hypothetical protein